MPLNRQLVLNNFALSEAAIERICATSQNLDSAYLDIDDAQYQRLCQCLPRTSVFPFIRDEAEQIFEILGGVRVRHGLAERVKVSLGGGDLWVAGARLEDVEAACELVWTTR